MIPSKSVYDHGHKSIETETHSWSIKDQTPLIILTFQDPCSLLLLPPALAEEVIV